MEQVALLPIVPSNVGTAIDREVYRAVPSKTRRRSVEVDSLPSLVGAERCLNISVQTASHSPQEIVGHGQRGSVEKPMRIVDYLEDVR